MQPSENCRQKTRLKPQQKGAVYLTVEGVSKRFVKTQVTIFCKKIDNKQGR